MVDRIISANRMTLQTRRRIGTLAHDPYDRYASWPIEPPVLVWSALGRHADIRSTI
jgi:hypothetical protein